MRGRGVTSGTFRRVGRSRTLACDAVQAPGHYRDRSSSSAPERATGHDAVRRTVARCVASPPSPDAATRSTPTCALGSASRVVHSTTSATSTTACAASTRWQPRLVDRDAVELALWFHDAVYEPGDATNERRSAELFLAQSAGARAGVPPPRRGVDSHHAAQPHAARNDCKFIDDIDLAGFGAPWEEFMANGDLLRHEFAAADRRRLLPRPGRVPTSLRRRPAFFRTDYFAQRYEAQAQAQSRPAARVMAAELTAPAALAR